MPYLLTPTDRRPEAPLQGCPVSARMARSCNSRSTDCTTSAATTAMTANASGTRPPMRGARTPKSPAAISIRASSRKHSDRLGQADEEAAPRTPLRGADADAGAVADFVLLIEQVDDVEPRREPADIVDRERVAHAEIDLRVAGQVGAVRNGLAVRQHQIGPEAGSVQGVDAESRVLPAVRNAARCGERLLVIEMDVVVGDVGQFVRAEIELAGDDVPPHGMDQ